MEENRTVRKIKRALISVFYKDGLEEIVRILHSQGVEIISTGGTEKFISSLSIPVTPVESLTGYPSILGGRVKTLHPKIFGGILNRRDNESDRKETTEYDIPEIDLVIVDLYPFEEYVAAGASHQEIIEKIDIGGISLIRGAAKNYNDVIIIASKNQYPELVNLLKTRNGESILEEREYFAARAFETSSHYDTEIFNYFNRERKIPSFKFSSSDAVHLRYGENPHQSALYFRKGEGFPEQLHGKEISYNNLLDIEAAIELISDFDETTVAILKHNNACGCASRENLCEAWKDALAGDPVSAFGGIIISNRRIDKATAEEMNKIFFEVVIAPDYEEEALGILETKKNRIILRHNCKVPSDIKFRSMLGGALVQERDTMKESADNLKQVTEKAVKPEQIEDLLFANKLVKHSKSNAIVLAKNKMLIASGVGQTSRVDALKQAITKAAGFNFDLKSAVMASDAFFPFSDCVQIAHEAGIDAVIQPGGSIRDQESIDYCNEHGIAMVCTGFRHFKH